MPKRFGTTFFARLAVLRQLAQRWGCANSGSSQSRRSLSAKLTAEQKAFILKNGFDLLQCFKTANDLCPFAL
jgi:hypothetical protein